MHGIAMLRDIAIKHVPQAHLLQYQEALQSGEALPLGSVSFIRNAMRCCGVSEPANLSYPRVMQEYLHRAVVRRTAGSLSGRYFIKPCITKDFTGGVFDLGPSCRPTGEQRASHEALPALSPDTQVWVSEVVHWLNEARYYVLDGRILGMGFYGEYVDEAPKPHASIVEEMVLRLYEDPGMPRAFALDVGVLSTGETALVECNDAWAIGYYKGTLSAEAYLAFLFTRWFDLTRACSTPHTANA